jgi:endogenous inhibitor of DNA gyrase (YacG/DUF329 family)
MSEGLSFARKVRCPHCGGESLYAPENRYRPFCSERCRAIDLGAWSTEQFRVEAHPEPDDDLDEPSLKH